MLLQQLLLQHLIQFLEQLLQELRDIFLQQPDQLVEFEPAFLSQVELVYVDEEVCP